MKALALMSKRNLRITQRLPLIFYYLRHYFYYRKDVMPKYIDLSMGSSLMRVGGSVVLFLVVVSYWFLKKKLIWQISLIIILSFLWCGF